MSLPLPPNVSVDIFRTANPASPYPGGDPAATVDGYLKPAASTGRQTRSGDRLDHRAIDGVEVFAGGAFGLAIGDHDRRQVSGGDKTRDVVLHRLHAPLRVFRIVAGQHEHRAAVNRSLRNNPFHFQLARAI